MNILRKWRYKYNRHGNPFWEYKGLFGPYAIVIEYKRGVVYWFTYTDYGGEISRGMVGRVEAAKAMVEKELKSESLW